MASTVPTLLECTLAYETLSAAAGHEFNVNIFLQEGILGAEFKSICVSHKSRITSNQFFSAIRKTEKILEDLGLSVNDTSSFSRFDVPGFSISDPRIVKLLARLGPQQRTAASQEARAAATESKPTLPQTPLISIYYYA